MQISVAQNSHLRLYSKQKCIKFHDDILITSNDRNLNTCRHKNVHENLFMQRRRQNELNYGSFGHGNLLQFVIYWFQIATQLWNNLTFHGNLFWRNYINMDVYDNKQNLPQWISRQKIANYTHVQLNMILFFFKFNFLWFFLILKKA